jgi:PLP dependent protein
MSSISENLQHVRREIDAACRSRIQTEIDPSHATALAPSRLSKDVSAHADSPITLIAVSKTKPAAQIREAFAAGQRDFGENYVQEGVEKIAALADLRAVGVRWHFIGPLQSNKAKLVAQHFDWVHGVDREKIAEALARHREGMTALDVCVQVNVSGEASKSGVAPSEVLTLARAVSAHANLRLRGLMTIIENTPDAATQRAQFRAMRDLQAQLADAGIVTDTLSMGMSQDFHVAIEEGATMVRIGSRIFGERV